MLISVMFQQIYNIADSMIAGKFVGEDAGGGGRFLSGDHAVHGGGHGLQHRLLGGDLPVFRREAAFRDENSRLHHLPGQRRLSAVLTVGGLLLSGPILRAIHTPSNIFADAALYLNIYIGGLVFLFLYNICTGVFNSLGDSRTPLVFLIGSSLGNIGLDLLFVTVFDMGVAGVAWATFIAQGAACLLSLARPCAGRLSRLETPEKSPLFSLEMLGRISRIAVPSILQPELHLGGQYVHPGPGQRLRLLRHRWLLRRRQA